MPSARANKRADRSPDRGRSLNADMVRRRHPLTAWGRFSVGSCHVSVGKFRRFVLSVVVVEPSVIMPRPPLPLLWATVVDFALRHAHAAGAPGFKIGQRAPCQILCYADDIALFVVLLSIITKKISIILDEFWSIIIDNTAFPIFLVS